MKLTFSEALERINEERSVDRSEIQSRALSRVLWVAEWHIPGCMSESRSYCTTKRDAIESACDMANICATLYLRETLGRSYSVIDVARQKDL